MKSEAAHLFKLKVGAISMADCAVCGRPASHPVHLKGQERGKTATFVRSISTPTKTS